LVFGVINIWEVQENSYKIPISAFKKEDLHIISEEEIQKETNQEKAGGISWLCSLVLQPQSLGHILSKNERNSQDLKIHKRKENLKRKINEILGKASAFAKDYAEDGVKQAQKEFIIHFKKRTTSTEKKRLKGLKKISQSAEIQGSNFQSWIHAVHFKCYFKNKR